MDHCGRCDMVSGIAMSHTRLQLLANCLQPLVYIAVPDLEFVAMYDGGLAIFVHATEPAAVIKRLLQLLLTNAIMLTDLHRTATARACRAVFSHDDKAHHVA